MSTNFKNASRTACAYYMLSKRLLLQRHGPLWSLLLPQSVRHGSHGSHGKDTFLVSPVIVDPKHKQRWGKGKKGRERALLFAKHREREAESLVKAANFDLVGAVQFRVKVRTKRLLL